MVTRTSAADAILAEVGNGWISRAAIFRHFRGRFTFSLVQFELARLSAAGVIWRRLDAKGRRVEPYYVRAQAVGDLIIPRRDLPGAISCPCCGAAQALQRPFAHQMTLPAEPLPTH